MTLEDHLKAGGPEPADLVKLPDGRWRDPEDGWVGWAFQFDYVGDREGVPGDWRGENRRTVEMRVAESIGRAIAGEKPLPWDRARREAYLKAWPVHAQIEALVDAAAGRTTKLDQMTAEFSAIKAAHPKPEQEK